MGVGGRGGGIKGLHNNGRWALIYTGGSGKAFQKK